MQEKSEESINIAAILQLLRKRVALIIISTLVVTIFGGVYTFFIATPSYTATTQLVAKLSQSDSSAEYAGQVSGNIQMTNTINQVIVSPVILDQVETNLGLTSDTFQSNVTATNQTNSQVITVSVKYSNPYTAQKIADETARVFSNDAAKLLNITNVSILAEAKVDMIPVSPRPTLYMIISILVGLLIGIALAFLIDALDNKVNTEGDVEAMGLSVLGATPFASESDFNNKVVEPLNVKEKELTTAQTNLLNNNERRN